ncbi:hypothetical protein V2J09_022332 [Rumex salicifolius]
MNVFAKWTLLEFHSCLFSCNCSLSLYTLLEKRHQKLRQASKLHRTSNQNFPFPFLSFPFLSFPFLSSSSSFPKSLFVFGEMLRPYECTRRAWHSERQQPIRGYLIKEIFGIAHEIHSPSTKKKREWQEKLPIVVLKAEEIMYSKANSEAEYMDPKTIWERVNDAIDTIIRQHESDEIGKFLQPCIEASLNLGCIPRRAMRSQKNASPRSYPGPYTLGRDDQPIRIYPPPPEPQPMTPAKPIFTRDKIMETGTMEYESSSYDKESSNTMKEDSSVEVACDLSLRLAPLSVSSPSIRPKHETRKRRAMEVVGDTRFPWQPKLQCTYLTVKVWPNLSIWARMTLASLMKMEFTNHMWERRKPWAAQPETKRHLAARGERAKELAAWGMEVGRGARKALEQEVAEVLGGQLTAVAREWERRCWRW